MWLGATIKRCEKTGDSLTHSRQPSVTRYRHPKSVKNSGAWPVAVGVGGELGSKAMKRIVASDGVSSESVMET